MTGPCVRVPRTQGETIRQHLADAGAIDWNYEIQGDDDWIYIPVTDTAAVPDEFVIVERSLTERDTQTMPEDILGFEPSYERLGDIVILHEDDLDQARRIADAIIESSIPVKTVVNRASPIKTKERVRDWEILVGEDTETVYREYGCEFLVDIAKVYFSPRLATERHRVIQQVEPSENVFDMFAGVGPFVIPFAKRGANTVGVDINEVAIRYLEENAKRNNVRDSVMAIHGDVRETPAEYYDWADRLVMNLPHSAESFLDTAIKLAGDTCTLHYYDIQPDSEPFEPGESVIRTAAESTYEVTITNRRVVRSYAPHAENICLDVRLESK